VVLTHRIIVGKVILEGHCNDQVTHDRHTATLRPLRLVLDCWNDGVDLLYASLRSRLEELIDAPTGY